MLFRSGYLGSSSHLREGLDETNALVEKEIEDIVRRNYNQAQKLIKKHWSKIEKMVDALMEYETIDKDQIDQIMVG